MTDIVERCEHGIRWPHPCDDCEAEASKPHNLIAQIEAKDATIASLRAERDKAVEGLKPFAEIAEWADRNGHNLHDFDMLIRHIAGTKSGQFAGHLGVQAEQFIAAQSLIKELQP